MSTTEPNERSGDTGRAGNLVRSSALVAVGTVASRVTGLARTILTATFLGAAGVGAAYNLANNTPNMVYDLLLGGILSATLVPTLVANRDRGDRDGDAAVLTLATVILVGISLAAIVLAPAIITLYSAIGSTGGRPPAEDEIELGVVLLRLFAPQVLFYGLATLGTAYLNAHNRFAAAALAPVVNNLWMIVVLVAAWRALGSGTTAAAEVLTDPGLVLLLGLGTTLGIAAMALTLYPAIRRAGLPLRWRLDIHHPAVRKLGRLSGWTLGYVIANQVSMFVIIGLATGDDGGAGVSYWNYAYQFFQLPYGVFTVSIMTAYTPELARLAQGGDRLVFREHFLHGLRLVCLVLLPSTALFAVLARPLITALLQYEAFTAEDVGPTAGTLAALAVGMVGFSLYLYTLRGFYAHQDTRIPFYVNLFENALTLVLAWVLAPEHGVVGLAWAWSIGYLVAAVVAFALLRRRTGEYGFESAVANTAAVIRMLLGTIAMAVVMAAIVAALPDGAGGAAWLELVVATAAGGLVYAGALHVLGVRELREVPRMLLRR